MEMMKFYEITHREHVICNPTNGTKLARLVELLRLPAGAQVADIACGKGEFLIRLAEAYGISGRGIDISSYYIGEADRGLRERVPDADLTFIRGDGADFKPEEPQTLDMVSCLGASWIYGGHAGTLDALMRMVKPGGWVIVGEPFWLQEPARGYLAATGMALEDFGSHLSNVDAGEQRGLDLVHTFVSSPDDWDSYEGLQWYALAEYARKYPDDPDLEELKGRLGRERAAYLRWGRDSLGWAIYMFRSRPSA